MCSVFVLSEGVMYKYENLVASFLKLHVCTLTFTFSTKLESLGFHTFSFLKMTAEKWPGGCILT